MSNKDRVYLQVFHRDAQTLAELERTDCCSLEIYLRYHWAILVCPKNIRQVSESATFDVTDGVRQADGTGQDLNPDGDWWFRIRRNVNPLTDGRFLVAVAIGKLPKGTTLDQVEHVLAQVPVPRQGMVPAENCCSWTRNAIRRLQQEGFAVDLDPLQAMDTALEAGNGVFKNGPPTRVADRFRELSSIV